jgi:uncharacterized protein
MRSEEIIAKIRASTPALRAEGVTKLAIFGSRAREDARDDSDLDLLIEVDPNAKFSLLDLIGVEHIIEDATGLRAQATCVVPSNREWRNASRTTSSRFSERS